MCCKEKLLNFLTDQEWKICQFIKINIDNVQDVGFLTIVYGSGGEPWLIGLYSSLSDGTYMWTDGHLYQYSNFADKEPAILEDDVQCVMIYENNNYWFTWNCNKTAPFICKKSGKFYITALFICKKSCKFLTFTANITSFNIGFRLYWYHIYTPPH